MTVALEDRARHGVAVDDAVAVAEVAGPLLEILTPSTIPTVRLGLAPDGVLIKWKGGTPPQVPKCKYDEDDARAWEKYEVRLDNWKRHVSEYLPRATYALMLKDALDAVPASVPFFEPFLNDEIDIPSGYDVILDILRANFAGQGLQRKRQLLDKYESVNRHPNETLRDYLNRYKLVEAALREVSINISTTYDNEARGDRLIQRAHLHPMAVQNIPHVSREERERNSICDICGNKGHYKKNCRSGGVAPGGSGSSVRLTKNPDDPSVEEDADHDDNHEVQVLQLAQRTQRLPAPKPQPRATFQTRVVSHVSQNEKKPDKIPDVVGLNLKVVSDTDLDAYLVIDSGCQRGCHGSLWEQAHRERLRLHGLTGHVRDELLVLVYMNCWYWFI